MQKIGAWIYRLRWTIITTWAILAALLVAFVPTPEAAVSQRGFLPRDARYSRAAEAFFKSFPDNSGLSEAVIVFERRGSPLSAGDVVAIEKVADRILRSPSEAASQEDLEGVTVRSPKDLPLPGNPMISKVSAEGQAALVKVNIPASFITARSARVVDHIRAILADTPLPKGLAAAVTGCSGFGRDYAAAVTKSHKQTLYVTLTAVVVILLLVYRAPLAALVPLAAISLAAITTMKLLALGGRVGLHAGTAEKIFVVIMLYGAGVDYSLLLISRYRENLAASMKSGGALAAAVGASVLAITAAAGTDTAGMLMLCFAKYGIFKSTGPAVAVALVVALAAAITLVPALVGIFGRRIFWPAGQSRPARPSKIWPRLAWLVTRRPAWVLAATLLALAAPAVQGLRLNWLYDTLAMLDGHYGARRGMEMARRHWPVGEIAPVKILLQTDRPVDEKKWQEKCKLATQALEKLPEIRNVRSLSAPLGTDAPPAANFLAEAIGKRKVLGEYLSADGRAARLDAVLDYAPLSLPALETIERIHKAVSKVLSGTNPPPKIHIAGATAEMADTREITQRDFHTVAALVLTVIFVIVMFVLRDVILTAFMVASTVLSYLATLGITYWVFAGLFGIAGLDWKVEVFLFVVMVAVGVDYNIFLAARLGQEARSHDLLQACRLAIVRTGPVISSCGLIMAATLGSLMAGELLLLRQLGFALALGMLMDTFVVRPLLLPSLVVLMGKTGRRRKPEH